MQAGPCAGRTGSGDCVNSGWSPRWLAPLAWADQVEALVGSDIVCPHCVVWRAVDARVPGWNTPKRNRVLAILDGFNCMKAEGSRSTGHTHLYDFQNESLLASRPEPPGQGERGF